MSAHIVCLTSGGGLPIFTRKRGEGDPLPFSVVASLNGVHMFGKSQDVVLQNTSTQETTFVWKEMEDSVILIAAARGASSNLLEKLLVTVFHAMILVVGIEEIRAPKNADRLKRELRVCYPLVDRLLECLESTSYTDLLGLDEVILCQENFMLQVPFRLVTCSLVAGVDVCVLCGPTPPLSEVEHTAIQCWKSALDLIRAAEQCYPRNFPHAIQLDSGVMGLLLVDQDVGKFMLSRNQTHAEGKKDAHRFDVLRTFYHQGASMLYKNSDAPHAVETYWCSEYHKCHAYRQGNILLCVLYAAAVPSHTMRIITRHTLRLLTSDKQLCW
ncbi:protein fuzzy isoform X4 [Anabrus simplex]|uniref:protein fuzzy isoform X4 n=1 Tax=Anabrus simplex TaxID=316456 RepID=UPI0035A2AE1E